MKHLDFFVIFPLTHHLASTTLLSSQQTTNHMALTVSRLGLWAGQQTRAHMAMEGLVKAAGSSRGNQTCQRGSEPSALHSTSLNSVVSPTGRSTSTVATAEIGSRLVGAPVATLSSAASCMFQPPRAGALPQALRTRPDVGASVDETEKGNMPRSMASSTSSARSAASYTSAASFCTTLSHYFPDSLRFTLTGLIRHHCIHFSSTSPPPPTAQLLHCLNTLLYHLLQQLSQTRAGCCGSSSQLSHEAECLKLETRITCDACRMLPSRQQPCGSPR
jgi:hypothetical protein